MSDSDTEAENAARLAVFRENVTCWTLENQKPWQDRSEFCIAELASELALAPGQIKIDRSDREQIVSDIYKRATQGECDEADVLMIVTYSRLLAPFLSECRAARAEPGDRQLEPNPDPDFDVNYPVLEQLPNGRLRVNMGAIILKRRAVRALLDFCELPGASRLRRRLGFGDHEQEHVSKAVAAGAGVRSSPSSVGSDVPPGQPRGRRRKERERVKSEMRERFCSNWSELADRTVWSGEELAKAFKTSRSTADRARDELLSKLP
jgi:hypothetical protein